MISSLLDNDFYKFTMQSAVRRRYPKTPVEYRLFSRGTPLPWNDLYLDIVRERIDAMEGVSLKPSEAKWLQSLDMFDPDYLKSLEKFRFDPNHVTLSRTDEDELDVVVAGDWEQTILWEVPLLAILSQTYYEVVDTGDDVNLRDYYDKSREKVRRLSEAGCAFSDFGTRRRRSVAVQEAAVRAFAQFDDDSTFGGTSNVRMAMRYGVKPVGTVAHEWTMAMSGFVGAAEANRVACRDWMEVHSGIEKIALTDTYTLEMFLENFDLPMAQGYDGVRHDSGDPMEFADRMIAFYEANGIDPKTKKLVFSDGLYVDRCIEIEQYVAGRAQTAYGIGTRFTNDIGDNPLNIVIKLTAVNQRPIAKLTEDMSKATGDKEAIERATHEVEQALGRSLERE